MFHEGSLQSGIALAIQQQKLVACFVRDDGATSTEWEEWLKSGWISNLLAQKAVVLRLEAASTEAGFLAAFCDITDTPTFVVIQNGQLQLQLKSHVEKEEFTNSIRKVLGAEAIPGSSAAQTPPPHTSTPGPTQTRTTTEAEDDLYGASQPYEPARAAPPTPAAASTPSAIAKGKQKATSSHESKPVPMAPSVTSAQQEARDALRKKKRDDAGELARIKARIEADKAARKAQAEVRKAERERERGTNAQTETQSRTTITSSRGSQAKTVNLNVRLFDGRTIRSIFPRTATLQEDVRSWVDKEFANLSADDPNINNQRLPPYFFRHILAPQPSHELSAGDESQSLGDIDLAPSATLVLVPVKGYTDAYSGASGGVVGTATGLLSGAFGLVSSTVGFVGSTLGSVIGYGSAPAGAQAGQTTESRSGQGSQVPASSEGSSVRVRTLADQRSREPRDQQFYNGNQLDTVPRNDDDDKRS
ncbi:uncharacterized protein K460DRAFT_408870 [Cucurbitaria berberidis CBS 394.84]|uniref:UBX domain-containing protein n=1 Tax=Cucurbitaria berberidis CBS 394.84 TaxID=1168544 RepID=A0A9P4G9Y2_9PLEO|nr:uncharacterized protein K460DRAFT_408870 [Cucurbitaria berberidis CBS 394.84]KAF1841404.1 hypothetical protein K460DRAFT_408870 [Cucurbitaria berberidis CBS 394.84]